MPFHSIIGHRRIVSLLARALARDTLPPALLLAGPAGVGKRRIATAMAEAINCLDPQSRRRPRAGGLRCLRVVQAYRPGRAPGRDHR